MYTKNRPSSVDVDWLRVKSKKQIEFCGCIIAGVHGAFAAGSSILAILFDPNLNHLELHGKLIKNKKNYFVVMVTFSDFGDKINLGQQHQLTHFFNSQKFFCFTIVAI